MSLRPYQIDLIEKARNAYRNGAVAPCIVLPCGGGKSVIVADIAKSATEKHNQVLFIVHRKELVEQIKRTFSWWGVDMSRCDVMMVQTASRRISRLTPPSLIITDENHHSKASTYRKIYDAFPNAKRIGVTATPVRLDGSGLGDVNDILVEGVSAKWLIENNYLAPYDYYAPSIADLTGIKIQHGEFETKSLEKVMLKKAVFGNAIKYYRQLADDKQAICYCVSVNHSMAMAEEFRSAGISAVHIDGSTPKYERDRIIADFRSGKIKILCNVDLISEGFDVPDCECSILLRPTKSLTLYIQQSMRCMRYKKGKKAIIIDHVGNYARFGMPDADREWSLEGKKKFKDKNDIKDEVKATQCPECFYTFEPPKFGRTVCPDCGYVFPQKERILDTEENTNLEKITGFVLDYDSSEQCKNMQELQAYAKKMGYKSGYAYYKGKEMGFIK
ncbi:MAG: DEAD/DEAH box helicase [Oscillospiraceae bacterium]|nr:DEAD/DEAH box helicase [Oscillospiraceae bacterium]